MLTPELVRLTINGAELTVRFVQRPVPVPVPPVVVMLEPQYDDTAPP